MPSFLQLSGGLPWWLTLAILVPLALYALLFLAMPFSVFGVKGRMEAIEARLDEIQEETRSLAIRSPEPSSPERVVAGSPVRENEPDLPRLSPEPASQRRPIPTARPERAEPRLDWPR